MTTHDESRSGWDTGGTLERRVSTSIDASRRSNRHYTRTDERIRDDIAERLYRAEHLDPSEVTVDLNDGVVTLAGSVPVRRMRHDIEDLAIDTLGVKHVENRIRVRASVAGAGSQDPLHGSPERALPDTEPPHVGRRSSRLHKDKESLLDVSIEESFPASDASSSVQPGSLAAEESLPRENQASPQH
jgi:hypothetical protein